MIFVIIRLVDISTEQIISYSKDKTNLVQIKKGKIITRSMIFHSLGTMLCGELSFSFNSIKIE